MGGGAGALPCQHPKRCCPSLQTPAHQHKKVSVFRVNQLLSAANANNAENAGVRYANANNAENAGVRYANANNRGSNTNANYGFPLYMPLRGYGSTRVLTTKNIT